MGTRAVFFVIGFSIALGLAFSQVVLGQVPAGQDTVWLHQFGSALSDEARAVACDTEAAYVVGWTAGALPGKTNPNPGAFDTFVRKYRADDGKVEWTDQSETAEWDRAKDVAVDNRLGWIYVVGEVYRG